MNGRLLAMALTLLAALCIVGIIVLVGIDRSVPQALELGLTGLIAGLIGHFTKPPAGGA